MSNQEEHEEVFTDDRDMVSALRAAVELGLGVRLSNCWIPDDGDDVDGDTSRSTLHWILRLRFDPPFIDGEDE